MSGNSREAFFLSSSALRQLDRLQLNASRFLPGHAGGLRPSLHRKPATDFHEHRLYMPGDDVRFVDWKASARQEHIFIKQGEHLKESTVHVLLDCSASMAWGNPPKSNCASSLAAALGYVALAHGDRLVMVPLQSNSLDGQSRLKENRVGKHNIAPIFGPISGKGQLPETVNYLRSLSFEGQCNFTQAIQDFSHRRSIRGGLILIISDLLKVDDLDQALAFLPAPTWDVVIIHLLSDEEINPTLRGAFEMEDIETGLRVNYEITPKAIETYLDRMQMWQKSLELACLENNAYYSLITSNWSLEKELIPYLREVNVLRAL